MAPLGYEGYWGPVTSSIDWCEPNYVWSPYVAELWNTLSSLVICFVGEYGAYTIAKSIQEFEHGNAKKTDDNDREEDKPVVNQAARVVPVSVLGWLFRMITTVGIGSVAFHSTLQAFPGQFADEAPMLWTAGGMLYLCADTQLGPFGWWWPCFMAIVTIIGTILTASTTGPLQFYLFQTIYQGLHHSLLILVWRIYRKYQQEGNKHRHAADIAKMFHIGMLAYILAALFWVVDLRLCPLVNGEPETSLLPINPQGHALWHVGAALGVYYLGTIIACDMLTKQHGYELEVRYPRALPVLPVVQITGRAASARTKHA